MTTLDDGYSPAPPVAAPTRVLDQLRALRLWHWQQVLMASANRDRAASGRDADRYRKEWAHHMGAVQTLNVFFPAGDYAEHDAARQDVA